MLNFEQIRFDYGKPPGPLAKILAVVAGLILFGASLFLGVVFFFAAIIFVAVVAIMARFRGSAITANSGSDTGVRRPVIEGDYVVMDAQRGQRTEEGEK